MPNHRVIVARGFRIVGLVTAIPSSLMAIAMGVAAFMATPSAAQQRPDYLSVTQYGLVGLLSNAMTGAGEVLSLLNGLAAVILVLVAVLALIAALFGVLLYVVGRGLHASARWARFVAAAMMLVVLLNSVPALSVLRGVAWLVAVIAPVAAIYVLWVLKARYAD